MQECTESILVEAYSELRKFILRSKKKYHTIDILIIKSTKLTSMTSIEILSKLNLY